MSVSSISSFIDVVNLVLANLNEPTATGFNTTMSVKAQRSVLDALRTIIQGTNWQFYEERLPALSWAVQVATVQSHSKLKRIMWGSDALGYIEIPQVGAEVWYRTPITSYTGTVTRPSQYFPYGFNQYAFNPYPADTDSRQLIIFHMNVTPVFPVSADDKIPFPEDFIHLVVYKAASMLALSHLQNAELSREWNIHFDMALHHIRSNRGRTIISMQPSGAR